MKLNLIYAFAIAGAMAAFSSCSNNDEPTMPGSSLEQKTYSGTDALTLNYNGSPLVGKTVTFTPGTGDNATLTLAGEALDVTQIMGMMTRESENPSLALPTAGVLPGSPSLSIPVKLQGDPDNCTFEGSGETDYCTYSYSGSVKEDACEFNLTDVKLKNTSLAGTWTVPETKGDIYNVARVEWDSDVLVNTEISLFPGMPPTSLTVEIGWLLRMALVMPLIETNNESGLKSSPIEMLSTVLKSVTFGEDGNLTAEYMDIETGEIKKAAPGIAQYTVTSDNTISLYLNPAAIIANTVAATKANTRGANITVIIEDLMQQLIPMLTQGIPVNYGPAISNPDAFEESDITNKDATAFYLGTETLLPILKAVTPLLSDEDFVNGLVEEAQKNPDMGMWANSLKDILNTLPDIVDTTTKIELGINLKK